MVSEFELDHVLKVEHWNEVWDLDFVLHDFVGLLSFDFSQEVSINGQEVDFLVVGFNLATVLGFLCVSLDFDVVVFLEQLPDFFSGEDEIFLLLESVSEDDVEVGEFAFEAWKDVRIEINNVLVDFGEGASTQELQ